MRLTELLLEYDLSDDAMRRAGWDGDPETKWLHNEKSDNTKAPTDWTSYDVICDILGKQNIVRDDEDFSPGQYYVYSSPWPLFNSDDSSPDDIGGSLGVPNLDSRDAKDVATAAHEAYHAWLHSRSRGKIYANEKIVNKLAARWLKQHLSGLALHSALELILHSNISYGHN
jgi:hypothetical protein